MDSIGSSTGGDVKGVVMQQIRQEAAMQNAKQLIEVFPSFSSLSTRPVNVSQKVNQHCFDKCVPKPSSSLSSGETTCFTQCMEKYMSTWNTVSRQYINRMQVESQKQQAGQGEMF